MCIMRVWFIIIFLHFFLGLRQVPTKRPHLILAMVFPDNRFGVVRGSGDHEPRGAWVRRAARAAGGARARDAAGGHGAAARRPAGASAAGRALRARRRAARGRPSRSLLYGQVRTHFISSVTQYIFCEE